MLGEPEESPTGGERREEKIWESELRGAPKLMRLSVKGKREAGLSHSPLLSF